MSRGGESIQNQGNHGTNFIIVFSFSGITDWYVNYEQEIASPRSRRVFHKEGRKANVLRQKRAKAFSTLTLEKSPLHLKWEQPHWDWIRNGRYKQEPDDPRPVVSLVSQVSDPTPSPDLYDSHFEVLLWGLNVFTSCFMVRTSKSGFSSECLFQKSWVPPKDLESLLLFKVG